MIRLGRSDQFRVHVDTDDIMPASCEFSSDPAGSTSGVEDARSAPENGVDQSSLSGQVCPVCRHSSEPFDVPPGMVRAMIGDPARQVAHPTTLSGSELADPGRLG
jgi:hypothetical protein